MPPRPLAVQLYTFREQLPADPGSVIGRIADMGFVGAEPLCSAGFPDETRAALASMSVDAADLKRMLDDHGLEVCSAHTALPEAHNAAAVLDEQELLGNDLLIVSALTVLPGGQLKDLDTLDTLQRIADRFNEAASLAWQRGMRVGFHNHWWEWTASIDGRSAYDVFWEHLHPSVVAEVDIYWAQVAGQDPAQVIAGLGERAQLVHVKDGPLIQGEPMTAVGSGEMDVAGALDDAEHLRWHIVEIDECATDTFDAVAHSARWLVDNGLSTARRADTNDDVWG